MALRFLLPALAIAGVVSGQSSSSGSSGSSGSGSQCSTSATLTVQNQGDATALANCATYSGSIAVATGTVDAINIPNVRVITGDLVMTGAPNITTLGADSLTRIGGDFTLNNDQLLSSLTFPQLGQVGNIKFNALPNLQTLGFTSMIKQAVSLDIENTFLTTLNGINLQRVGSIYIANNRLLQEVSFQVGNISDSMTIEGNGDRLSVLLPNLSTAQNITLLNCANISIPSLAKISGNLGFKENTISSLYAPNLTNVGGTLSITGNTKLSNVSLPVLTTLGGGFQVQNNTILTDLGSAFPAVQSIGGAFDFYGAFSSVKLPALKDNRGAFNLQSSGDVTADCATFKAQAGSNNVIKGKFQCAGNQTTPGSASTTPSSGSSGAKKSDAGALRASSNAAVGIGAVLAAMLGLL